MREAKCKMYRGGVEPVKIFNRSSTALRAGSRGKERPLRTLRKALQPQAHRGPQGGGSRTTTHLINGSARSNSSLSGTFQESFQRSVRNEEPTRYFRMADTSLGRPLGLPSRSSVGGFDCVLVNLLLMHGCGRSVGPLAAMTANTRIGGSPFASDGRFGDKNQ
jgi:hypothetical protein